MELKMNQIVQRIEADVAVAISDLKRNPMAAIKAAGGQPVAILNHARVVGYIISPGAWENMLECLEDIQDLETIHERRNDPTIAVSLDEL
jgi:antitoxin StbD